MTSTLISGITTITTISAISLSDDFTLGDVVDNFKEVFTWIDSWLPRNLIVRASVYATATLITLRMVPVMLRKTAVIKSVEFQNRYFHRSTFHPDLLKIKSNMLKELKDGSHNLPLYNEELVLLELNAGGGSNLSYYPECRYIATDYLEDGKEFMEDNASNMAAMDITFDRYLHTIPDRLVSVPDNSVSAVICFHSLCSSLTLALAVLEIRRVLMPTGKVYFLEHVSTSKKYSRLWLAQLNFQIQMYFWDCKFVRGNALRRMFDQSGFKVQQYNEITLDFTGMQIKGPMTSLASHAYGVAVKQ